MALKLYANWISQPSRAVAWLMKVKGVQYEHIRADFGSPIFKSPEFLAMNPNGLIPVLKDDNFVLFESHAIMTYVADKFQWEDVYPKDLQARAKINEYLHWHHLGARKLTLDVVRPYFRRAMGVATPSDVKLIENAEESINKQLVLIEKFLVKDYVALTDVPTIADYSLYCEVDQLESMALLHLDNDFPKTAAWLDRMKKISFHDEVRLEMNGAFKSLGLMGVGKGSQDKA